MPRVKFKAGLQRKFLQVIEDEGQQSVEKLARELKISPRTFRDWRREKYTISEEALRKLENNTGFKADTTHYKILSDFWSVHKAARKAGLIVAARYGGPGTPEGRKKGGKISQIRRKSHPERYQNCNLRKEIITPSRNEALAEFIGIMLGDGTLSSNH